MIAAVTTAWALFLGVGLIMLGNGLQGSLLGLRATLEGFPTTVTGIVMSGYFLGFLAGSALAPRLVERVGHIRVFAALASLASIAILVHVLLLDPVTWAAMRLLTGFSYAGLYVVSESWINDRATNETRGQLLSVYMVVVLGGMAGGQGLLNIADPGGYDLFLLASILVSVALVPMLLTAAAAPEFARPARVGLRRLYRISPLGVVGSFATGMAHGALFGMGAVYAESSGLSVAQVSAFMGVAIVGGVLLQWPIGRLSDRLDRRLVLTAVTGLAALSALGAFFASGSFVGLLVLIGLFGGTCLPMYSLCVAHTNDHLQPEEMVAASGSLYVVVGLGATLGPLLVSTLMAGVGPGGFLVYLATVHGAIGVFALYRMTRRASPAAEDRVAYVGMSAPASPLAGALAADAALEQMEQDQ